MMHSHPVRPSGTPRSWVRLFAALILALTVSHPALAARSVPNFNLVDLRGHDHELQRADAKAVVLFFTGVGCPIARKSAPKLRRLRERFGDRGVVVWVVNAYPGDSAEDCVKEVSELGLLGFPYLRDSKQAVALALGVERTAEVVVLDPADLKVIYQGAIDDQYVEGGELPKPRERHLEKALDAFLTGAPVTVDRTRAHGCRFSFAKVGGEDGKVSYARDVAPLLRQHCVECHREGAIAPWAMDGFDRVRNHNRMIEEVLLTRRMPPWDPHPDYGVFENGNSLTREQTQTLLRWIQAGAERGEGEDALAEVLPPIPDWPLGKPTVVMSLPKPESVPATGVVEYRHIPIPSPFTNEVWISGTDIKPGNRRVVHHAILYAKWPGSSDDGTGNGVFVCGWAPGTPPARLPEGVAQRIPAGAEFNLEMHYTTCGSEQSDQTEVALYLAPGPQRLQAQVRKASEYDIDIPPGMDESRHSAVVAFPRAATLYSFAPHMHVRGKWMRYELLLPNGTRETLLHVPRYDFNWQFTYRLETPRRVPAGSWLRVTGAFDNTPGKPGNPDPGKRIHLGLQSWDEMFIGFFVAADDPGAAENGTTAATRPGDPGQPLLAGDR